jgi:hypothetical protein
MRTGSRRGKTARPGKIWLRLIQHIIGLYIDEAEIAATANQPVLKVYERYEEQF